MKKGVLLKLNERNVKWPWYHCGKFKAISPSALLKWIDYISFENVPKVILIAAGIRGQRFEKIIEIYLKDRDYEKVNDYIETWKNPKNNEPYSIITTRKNYRKAKMVMDKLDEDFEGWKLKQKQRVLWKYPYACIIDFILEKDGEEIIIECKTSSPQEYTDLRIDITLWLQYYSSGLPEKKLKVFWIKDDEVEIREVNNKVDKLILEILMIELQFRRNLITKEQGIEWMKKILEKWKSGRNTNTKKD